MKTIIYAQGDDDVITTAPNMVVNILLSPYQRIRKYPEKPFMLDNGGFQGKTVSSERLLEACEKMKPRLVIAPDVRYDPLASEKLTLDFLEKANEKILKNTCVVFRPKLSKILESLKLYGDYGVEWLGFPSGENLGVFKTLQKRRFKKVYDDYGFRTHVLGSKTGITNIGVNIHFDSIDFVAADIHEYNAKLGEVQMLEDLKSLE